MEFPAILFRVNGTRIGYWTIEVKEDGRVFTTQAKDMQEAEIFSFCVFKPIKAKGYPLAQGKKHAHSLYKAKLKEGYLEDLAVAHMIVKDRIKNS